MDYSNLYIGGLNSKMKHAYLLLAHNEFIILQKLINAIDDIRNDIYVHIDAKVKIMPKLTTSCSKLTVLKKRIKSSWGDSSLIAAELELFKIAYNTDEYSFFHLISGVHYPLKSQDDIHAYFNAYSGKSVLLPMNTNSEEIQMRFGYYHFFLKYLVSKNFYLNKLSHYLWNLSLFIQKKIGIRRSVSHINIKASQWCSLSNEAVKVLLNNEKYLSKFKRTFCPDEYYIPYVLTTNCIPIVYDMHLLYVDFDPYTPKILLEVDYQKLIQSQCIFARKLSSDSLALINKIDLHK